MKPFPMSLLGKTLEAYVKAAAAALGCDPAFIAVPLLPALASAIGNTRRIRLTGAWTEPSVIWAVIVGASGTMKSPALDLAIRAPWRRQCALLRDYSRARAKFEAEQRAWKAKLRNDRGEPPQPPDPCEHPVCSDITVEALADRLLCTPRGTLIALDEFAAWFGSFNQYKAGGADVAHWLGMHGARALKVDRKGGDKTTIYVPNAAVSIIGTIQPDTLRRVLLPEYFDNGLAARLLVAMPPAKPKRWTDLDMPNDVTRAIDDLFDNLYALRAEADVDGGDAPVMVDLTDAAREMWGAFVTRHNEPLHQMMEGPERAAAAKLEGYGARFALISHCVRLATGEKDSDFVDVTDIEAGVQLVDWFGAEARRVYRAMHESAGERQRRMLLVWIAAKGGRVTVRDLQRHLRRYEKDQEAAEADLNELVNRAHGSWCSVASTSRGGRPTQVFCLAESPDFVIASRADADTTSKNTGEDEVSSASAA